MLQGSLFWIAYSAQKYIHNTFKEVLVFDFHTPLSGIFIHLNTKLKLTVNSACTYRTETAFCTKKKKKKVTQLNNCHFLVLHPAPRKAVPGFTQPHQRTTHVPGAAAAEAPLQCTHPLVLYKFVSIVTSKGLLPRSAGEILEE